MAPSSEGPGPDTQEQDPQPSDSSKGLAEEYPDAANEAQFGVDPNKPLVSSFDAALARYPNTVPGNSGRASGQSADEIQGDAMQALLERDYGIPRSETQPFTEDKVQGDAMQQLIQETPDVVNLGDQMNKVEFPGTAYSRGTQSEGVVRAPAITKEIPPPAFVGRSPTQSSEQLAQAEQARTQAKEQVAEQLRQTYWEVQDANPELSPEEAVGVARELFRATDPQNPENQDGEAMIARVEAKMEERKNTPVTQTTETQAVENSAVMEEGRGFEAYREKFERDLVTQIANMPQEARLEAGVRLANMGFKAEKYKNEQMENIWRGASHIFGGNEERQNWFGRMLNAMGDQYRRNAERNDRTIQSIEKLKQTGRNTGLMTKFANLGFIARNANRVAQVAGLSVIPGGAVLALGTMAGASAAEAGKEARLTSEGAMEKTRISEENLTDMERRAAVERYGTEPDEFGRSPYDRFAADKAQDEAIGIMESAMRHKSGSLGVEILTPAELARLDPKEQAEYQARMSVASGTINAKDLEKAYEQNIAENLEERIRRFNEVEPGTKWYSRMATKMAGKMMEWAAGSTENKLAAIESDTTLTLAEKNARREEVMNRFGRGQLMRDMDRLLSQAGTLDGWGTTLWATEKGLKAAVAAVSIKNLYDMGHRFFGAPPPATPDSGMDRFVAGSNAMRQAEIGIEQRAGLDRFIEGANAVRASDMAIEQQEITDRFIAAGNAARAADIAIEQQAGMDRFVEGTNAMRQAEIGIEQGAGADRFIEGANAARAADVAIEQQATTDRFIGAGNAMRDAEWRIENSSLSDTERFTQGGQAARFVDQEIESVANRFPPDLDSERTEDPAWGSDSPDAYPAESQYPADLDSERMEIPRRGDGLEGVPEYTVVSGDNLTKIFRANLPALQGLSPAEQERAIQGVLRAMSPEDLKGLGVKSGNMDLIYPGEKPNLTKFNELIAAKLQGGGGGGKVSAGAVLDRGGVAGQGYSAGNTGGGAGAQPPVGGGVPPGGRGEQAVSLGTIIEEDRGASRAMTPEELQKAIDAERAAKAAQAQAAAAAEAASTKPSGTSQAVQSAQEVQPQSGARSGAEEAAGTGKTQGTAPEQQPQGKSQAGSYEDSNRPRMQRTGGLETQQGEQDPLMEKYRERPEVKYEIGKQKISEQQFESQWRKRIADLENNHRRELDALNRERNQILRQAETQSRVEVTRGIGEESARVVRDRSLKGLGERAIQRGAQIFGNDIERSAQKSGNLEMLEDRIRQSRETFQGRMREMLRQEEIGREELRLRHQRAISERLLNIERKESMRKT